MLFDLLVMMRHEGEKLSNYTGSPLWNVRWTTCISTRDVMLTLAN